MNDIESKIEAYLGAQHCVLWGKYFDLTSKEGPEQAREFILDLLIDLGMTQENIDEPDLRTTTLLGRLFSRHM